MHRTQLLLEDWQYEMLKARAERERRSLADVVREILTRALEEPDRRGGPRGISELAGIVNEPDVSGRNHDDIVYGPKRARR